MTDIERVASGFRLLEGPVWDPELGILFADAEGGGVFCLGETGLTCVVRHRRGIGGMARHRSGGLIVSGRNVAYKDTTPPSTVVLLENDPDKSRMVGFSDMCADPTGRILAGMLGSRPTESNHLSERGCLWIIDLDGSARCIIAAPKIKHTNGMAFSPDDTVLYYADSGKHAVFSYDYDSARGQVGPARLFAQIDTGIPDGLAVAVDGSVWVANAFAGKVLVFGPDGRLRRTIHIPQDIVTNVCFGGADMTDIFFTTGSLDPTEKIGSVYRMTADVPGLVPHVAGCPVVVDATPPVVAEFSVRGGV